MFTSEVLNKAADLIEERGWTTGQGWPGVKRTKCDSPASLCLEGGIMAALGMAGDKDSLAVVECPAYLAVRDYLNWDRRVVGKTYLFQWNDKPERTQAEVIEVLRAAAVIEAAREEQDAAWSTYAEQVSA